MVFAGKKHSFTLDIKGDSIKPSDQPNWVLINNSIVQATCVPLPGGKDASKCPLAQQREILNGYVDYEMAYFHEELKLVTKDVKKEWPVIGGRQFLLWYFDVPKQEVPGAEKVKRQTIRQVYLSEVWFDQVLDLNNALINNSDLEKAKAILYPIARSLKSSDGELDIAAYAKTLK